MPKPLPEPMMTYHQLDTQEKQLWEPLIKKQNFSFNKMQFRNIVSEIVPMLFSLQCVEKSIANPSLIDSSAVFGLRLKLDLTLLYSCLILDLSLT